MCLEVKTSKLEIKTAKENIICYKRGYVGKSVPGYIGVEVYESPYYYHIYQKGVLQPKVKFNIVKSTHKDVTYVSEGYHSYISFWNLGSQVFIIPKEAEYIAGGDNEIREKPNAYVSDQIVWIGNKWSPITWLKLLFYYFK